MDRFSINIKPGELMVLLGPSECGSIPFTFSSGILHIIQTDNKSIENGLLSGGRSIFLNRQWPFEISIER